MKVLVNATPQTVGGAVQVAVATIREALADDRAQDWLFAVSQQVFQNLQRLTEVSTRDFQVFPESPAGSWALRRRLSQLERDLQPDAVFTIFGPTYVEFQSPHLMGCAIPWITHPSRLALQSLSLRERLEYLAKHHYRRWWLRKADRWMTETETSRTGMHRRIGLPLEHIAVVPNTCAQVYLERRSRVTACPPSVKKIRLFTFSASYPQKRLDLIPQVAAALARLCPAREFEFILTLPDNHPGWQKVRQQAERLGVANRVVNVGQVAMSDGPAWYESCDVAFLPTVLETFSAAYPEAMAMGLPMVTSDLDFARDICGAAACYFEPCQPEAAARAILELLDDPRRWAAIIDRGKRILATLPTPRQKYLSFFRLLEAMVAGEDFTGLNSDSHPPTATRLAS